MDLIEAPRKPKVIWSPLPGSQTLAMSCPADIILYHGSRGPGKTDAQLMRFRRWVGQGFGRHWRGIIFDREYKNLDDLVAKSQRWFPLFNDKAKFLSGKADYRWVWPTGEELLFRAIKKPTDYWGYHGQEFPFIAWNELTKYPDDTLFESMMSCNRSSFRPEDYVVRDEYTGEIIYTPPEIPLEVFATCNPYGAGHNWVKERFIDASPRGTIHRETTKVFNPKTQKDEEVTRTQAHIFGSYKENKYLDAKYIASLSRIKDPNKKKAWLDGNWDVTAGGMFDDMWDSEQHIVAPFKIPSSWRINRAFDWGSSRPFSVGWWAESDGTEYRDKNGNPVQTIKGDLFRIAEWYGTNGETNKGLKLLPELVAKGIVEKEIALGIYKRVVPGPADNSIWDEDRGKSIAKTMLEKIKLDNGMELDGVAWLRSNKSAGSRKLGWEEIRKMLYNAMTKLYDEDKEEYYYRTREKPGLFTFSTCKYFIKLFPSLPRDDDGDPDDVNTDSEDHIGDETRYRVLQTMNAMSTSMGTAE